MMKCFMRFGGMAVLVLWIVLGLINPAAAAQPIDLSSMSTDGIMSQMEKTFDGLNAQGRKGHGRWHHGFPDPKAFCWNWLSNMYPPIQTRVFPNITE
jgi:hypothetical protein